MGKRIGRVKVRKIMGGDKASLIGKEKAARTSKAKQGIHLLVPTSRQVFGQLWESRVPSRITVTWEDKCCDSKRPLFFLLSPSFYC